MGATTMVPARANIPCLTLNHPRPVIHEILHCATKGTRLVQDDSVLYQKKPAYHELFYTQLFPTPVQKEVPVSGVGGNSVRT
jgi:hypothetical protein